MNIYDSGIIENERGSINFDDEGVLTSKNLLIENGILKNYMHDKISANHFKTNPTGNGRRESYAHYPIPRMTTTYLANGESDPDDILKSVSSKGDISSRAHKMHLKSIIEKALDND